MQYLGIEIFQELFDSIKQNKVRTILSGFGIYWGILILVVLLGTGQGFQEAVMNLFSVFAQKSIYVYGGETSLKHNNIKEGKAIRFDAKYLAALQERFLEIEAISPQISSSLPIQSSAKSSVFNVIGIHDDYMQIKILQVQEEGRLFTYFDMDKERPVAIIGDNVATTLFANQSALNKQINISGLYFRIIGILKNDNIFSAADIHSVYIPYSTYIRSIDPNPEFSAFCLSLTRTADSKQFEEDLRNYLAYHSHFAVNDPQAVYIANFETQTSAFESLFNGLRYFIWGIGICFLISGIVGISNIMFVIVRERTNEIGIRRAVGASPQSIIHLILSESIVITGLAGIIGLITGKGILMLIDWTLSMIKDNSFMQHTTLNTQVAFMALVVLILAGILAGAFPAIKASTIKPVDAIRHENMG
jgi:putative ABC transport system permease protein